MLSMTGFGLSKVKAKEGHLIVQVKSVNSRYLDVKVNIPREYSLWEKDIRQRLKAQLHRGTVEVYCVKKISNSEARFEIQSDETLARSWLKEYKSLSKKLKMTSGVQDLRLVDIMRSAPVLSVRENKDAVTGEKELFFQGFEQALQGCLQERAREGRSLKKSFSQLLKSLSVEVKKIEKNRSRANSELQKRYKLKIKRFKDEKGLDPARLAQEVSLLIEKSDINEEVIRLHEHISNCKNLLEATTRLGKKLEFYTQELLREINTIGSKSQIVELTNSVVNAKTIIEQIREQVQNIE